MPPTTSTQVPVVESSHAVNRDRYARVAQVVLIVATIAALWPVCANQFTTWDDNLNVYENPRLNPLTLGGVLHYWAHSYLGLYIPVTYSVWGAIAVVARSNPDAQGITLNPFYYHLANLLIHVGAVLVAFQILRLLTGHVLASAIGALLFAIHPLQVEPVAWVAGLKDVLCGCLSLVTLWQYLLFAGAGRPNAPPPSGRNRAIHYSLATLALILAMLSKPSAATVPLAAIILDFSFLHRPWKQVARSVIPWLVLAVGCAVVARVAQKVTDMPPGGGHLWIRPLLAGAALAFYLYKLIWPVHLALIYHYSPEALIEGHWLGFAWLVPFVLAIVLWVFRKRWPWLPAGAGLLVVGLLPVLGLTPFQFEGQSLVADHYMYVAMIGPALALAFALASTRRPEIAAGICGLGLLIFGVLANLQTAFWHDTDALFGHNLAVNPRCGGAYNSLAVQAIIHNDLPSAERLAWKSIYWRPGQFDAYVTLGSILNAEGRPRAALPAFMLAYHRDPNSPGLLNDLAGLLTSDAYGSPKNLADAERLCRRAIEIEPTLGTAHNTLAMILSRQGRDDEALREAQIGVHYTPTNPRALARLADLLARHHQYAAAMDYAQRALRYDPNYAPAQQLLDDLTRKQADEVRSLQGFKFPNQ